MESTEGILNGSSNNKWVVLRQLSFFCCWGPLFFVPASLSLIVLICFWFVTVFAYIFSLLILSCMQLLRISPIKIQLVDVPIIRLTNYFLCLVLYGEDNSVHPEHFNDEDNEILDYRYLIVVPFYLFVTIPFTALSLTIGTVFLIPGWAISFVSSPVCFILGFAKPELVIPEPFPQNKWIVFMNYFALPLIWFGSISLFT